MFHRVARFILTGLAVMLTLVFGGRPAAASHLADGTPTPEGSMEDDHGDRLPANGATISIVSPEDDATLTGRSVTVKVEKAHFTLGEGNHWHVYVDGSVRGMSQGNSDTQIVNDLEPGEHEIEVVLSTSEHQELDASDHVIIHVEAEGTGGAESHAESEAQGETAAPASTSDSLLTVGAIVAAIAVVAGAGILFGRRK